MKEKILFLAFLCHVLPQVSDGNAQGNLGPPPCSFWCRASCIRQGYSGGFCLPMGPCNCHMNGRVVGPVVDMINNARELEDRPPYFPSNYFDPYQVVRPPPMMEFPRIPPPPGPPQMVGAGGFMSPEVPEVPAGMAGNNPQNGYLPVETMSADKVVLETKPEEIVKESSESIGIIIGDDPTPEGGQKNEMQFGWNSTEYLPPDGKEEERVLPKVVAKKPSTVEKDDGPMIQIDENGNVVNNMTILGKGPIENMTVETGVTNELIDAMPEKPKVQEPKKPEEPQKEEPKKAEEPKKEEPKKAETQTTKARRKRDADNRKLSQREADKARRKILLSAEHKIAERRKILDEGERQIAEERKMLNANEKKILEERRHLDQKETAEDSRKPDLDMAEKARSGKLDNKNQDKLAEVGKKIVEDDKQSFKDDKAKEQNVSNTNTNKKPKKTVDKDALSEKKVRKSADNLDSMLLNLSKDPVGAIGTILDPTDGKGLFADSLFGL